MRNFTSRPLLIVFFIVILMPFSVTAEFVCQTEVQYKWVRAAPPQAETKEESKDEPTSAAASELIVYWTSIEQKGSTEDEAKSKVAKSALTERVNAERACINTHQNLAGCIATKYASLSSSVSALGFTAKKSVEDAIKSDCEKQQGKCSGSTVTEVKCSEIVVEQKAAETAKDPKSKKK